MIDFSNSNAQLFLDFLWLGLFFGLILIAVDCMDKVFKKNLYIHNILWFLYVLAYGFAFSINSLTGFNYSFCWFGLLGMLLGTILVKISLKFLFDKLVAMIYNVIIKQGELKRNGKLRKNKKG